jgi:hypothetical protein
MLNTAVLYTLSPLPFLLFLEFGPFFRFSEKLKAPFLGVWRVKDRVHILQTELR